VRPIVFGQSHAFLYRTIGPQFAKQLAVDDIECLRRSLSVSLVADSYFLRKIASRDASAAADLYIRIESAIPTEIMGSRNVIEMLIECLDQQKARNPRLRCLKNECEPELATILYIFDG
jgi:hypothetical protein